MEGLALVACMMGGEASGFKAGNSSTRRHCNGRSAAQAPSQDSWSDGPIGNTGLIRKRREANLRRIGTK